MLYSVITMMIMNTINLVMATIKIMLVIIIPTIIKITIIMIIVTIKTVISITGAEMTTIMIMVTLLF